VDAAPVLMTVFADDEVRLVPVRLALEGAKTRGRRATDCALGRRVHDVEENVEEEEEEDR